MTRHDFTGYSNILLLRRRMNNLVIKREARLVPPFFKGGLGGISVCHDLSQSATIKQNPPRPPFGKGGRSLCNRIIHNRVGLTTPELNGSWSNIANKVEDSH